MLQPDDEDQQHDVFSFDDDDEEEDEEGAPPPAAVAEGLSLSPSDEALLTTVRHPVLIQENAGTTSQPQLEVHSDSVIYDSQDDEEEADYHKDSNSVIYDSQDDDEEADYHKVPPRKHQQRSDSIRYMEEASMETELFCLTGDSAVDEPQRTTMWQQLHQYRQPQLY